MLSLCVGWASLLELVCAIKELVELEARVRQMVIAGTMSLETASTVLGYRVTGCSPEKKKARVEDKPENPLPDDEKKNSAIDTQSDRGPPNDCPAEAGWYHVLQHSIVPVMMVPRCRTC